MFILALAGSAFTKQARSSKADLIVAYYEDPNYSTCDFVQLDDGKCIADNVGYPCTEYISGIGWSQMYQNGIGSVCYTPYYSYGQ